MTFCRLMLRTRRALGLVASQFALFLMLPAMLYSQTIIPADGKYSAPDGFSFQGTWSCGDSSTAGEITISPAPRQNHSSAGLGGNWTEVVENDGKAAGHYFVGYDRDKRQFLMIDADDPAYAAYSTEGWRDRHLTLTPVVNNDQSPPWYRLIYEVKSPLQFTITWELWRENGWIVKSVSTCNRQQTRPRR